MLCAQQYDWNSLRKDRVVEQAKSDKEFQAQVIPFGSPVGSSVVKKEDAMFFPDYIYADYDWDSLRKNRDFC